MTDFRAFAACRDVDPEWFFPMGRPGSPGFERLAGPARSVCRGCPVRVECLSLALGAGLDEGIFGGLDPAQRRALRQVRAAERNRRRREATARAARLA